MDNPELFEKKLKTAKKIRKIIQEEYRADYNRKKTHFKNITGLDGNEVLKHLVDMKHYASGGYPSENSLPYHEILLKKFIIFFKFFHFLGWEKEFIHDYLSEYGIKVEIEKGCGIVNTKFDEDQLEEVSEIDAETIAASKDLKSFLESMILYCDDLQSHICNHSNQIKRGIAKIVKEECGIKTGHFTSTVMFEYKKDVEKEKAALKGKDDNLIKLNTNLAKDAESFNDMNEIKKKDLLKKQFYCQYKV